jgi:hypothetical protein
METCRHIEVKLQLLGCRRGFRPYTDEESGSLMLVARRPAQISGGRLAGTMIDLYGGSVFRVRTPHTKKAKAAAARHGLRIRVLCGECELFIPANLADTLLQEFGAKVKRSLTAAQLHKLRAVGFKNKPQKHTQEASSGGLTLPDRG